MKYLATFVFLLTISFVQCNCPAGGCTEPACPAGKYQKPAPSPEKDLQMCNDYKCNSCCSTNITKQISVTPLERVGTLSYHQCNKSFSNACSKETSYMECFYQCSPNLYPWMNEQGKLRNVPICASFCEAWFATCKTDYTCVAGESWLTGLNYGTDVNGDPVNPCKSGVQCRTYEQVYGTAENMCNTMFSGVGFSLMKYTLDNKTCLIPSDPVHNKEAAMAMKPDSTPITCESNDSYTDTGLIVGIVFAVLGGLFLIGAAVAFYLRTKQGKGKDKPANKPKEATAKPEEMDTLNKPKNQPGTPPNTRDGSDIEEA